MIPPAHESLIPPVGRVVRLAAGIKKAWRAGDNKPSLAAALAAYPSLALYRSAVIDLAYEEYCLREESGDTPSESEFCDRYPAFADSIAKVLAAHRLIADSPELLSVPDAPWPEPGDRLEGMELIGHLGRGSFGRAFLAFDEATNRTCVVKLATGRSAEGRIIGGLGRHPHITDVYWSRVVGNRTAVCMPYVGSTTLEAIRAVAFPKGRDCLPKSAGLILEAADNPSETPDGRDLPATVTPGMTYSEGVAAVMAKVAGALSHVHAGGLVHGDLKPSNVILGPGAIPYLIDFNLSSDGPVAGGTLPYMAPEILSAVASDRPSDAVLAGASDVYSLGVVLHELLTGRLPFEPTRGETREVALDLRDRALSGFQASAAGPTLPACLDRLVRECLSPNPSNRPSASEASTRLESWAHRRLRRKRRGLVALVAILGVGLAIAGAARPMASSGELQVEKFPSSSVEFLERGKSRLSEARYSEALGDFAAANRGRNDPQIDALEAYCQAQVGLLELAAAKGKSAVRGGVRTVPVLNNLGYCRSRGGSPLLAVEELDQAAAIDPRCREVLYNRSVARFRAGLSQSLGMTDPRSAEDMGRIVRHDDLPAAVYRQAADVFAASSAFDPSYRGEAIECLRKAVRRGVSPNDFLRDKLLTHHLGASPDFAALETLAANPPPATSPAFGLLEPK